MHLFDPWIIRYQCTSMHVLSHGHQRKSPFWLRCLTLWFPYNLLITPGWWFASSCNTVTCFIYLPSYRHSQTTEVPKSVRKSKCGNMANLGKADLHNENVCKNKGKDLAQSYDNSPLTNRRKNNTKCHQCIWLHVVTAALAVMTLFSLYAKSPYKTDWKIPFETHSWNEIVLNFDNSSD